MQNAYSSLWDARVSGPLVGAQCTTRASRATSRIQLPPVRAGRLLLAPVRVHAACPRFPCVQVCEAAAGGSRLTDIRRLECSAKYLLAYIWFLYVFGSADAIIDLLACRFFAQHRDTGE
jgi:hypothetical protein